jgi:hypothetical protein
MLHVGPVAAKIHTALLRVNMFFQQRRGARPCPFSMASAIA